MKVAADAGNTLAQFNLAQMYVQEDRGPTGLSKALPYYEKAAKTGLPDAQYAMAQIFASGVAGRKQDLAEARRYLLPPPSRVSTRPNSILEPGWSRVAAAARRQGRLRLAEAGGGRWQCRRHEPAGQTL
jgi:hypothetical protein